MGQALPPGPPVVCTPGLIIACLLLRWGRSDSFLFLGPALLKEGIPGYCMKTLWNGLQRGASQLGPEGVLQEGCPCPLDPLGR